jgi:hypothetical protein
MLKKLLIVGVLSGTSLSAQTPATKISDSLYTLAVNPANHPDLAYVWLLDEGVNVIEADGRVKNTTRQVVQILKPEGAETYRERQFSWNPEHQKFTVNWMRVVKLNGEVIAEKPEQVRDSDVPAGMDVPMYTAMKVRRMSLSGLEPGTILDFSFTTESDAPMMPGEFMVSWRVTTPTYVVRSNLVVDMPVSMKPRITERNLDFKRAEHVEKGRRLYAWRAASIDRFRGEGYAPDYLSQGMTISVSPAFTWSAIGKWYVPIARDAYAITPSVEEKMKTVLASSKTLDDSVRAIHKWIAQDIRYVAIELGRGGYVPRNAETVVRTGFGDCKDKAMLFVAALKKIGVTAYPVLLNINGSERKDTPSLGQLNHMIAAVKRGKEYQFADLTAGTFALGRLPRSEQGNLAVLVKENDGEEITLPEDPSSDAMIDATITGNLGEDGVFTGKYEEVRHGYLEATMRAAFQSPLDSLRKEMFGRVVTGIYFDRPETDSLVAFDGKDLQAEAKVSTRITRAKMVVKVGDVNLLTNPMRPMESYVRIADAIEKETGRTAPYDVTKFVPQYVTHSVVRIKLPVGWNAVLPKSEKLDSPIARYELKFSQVGGELRIERTIAGLVAVLPASRRMEIVEVLRKLGSDEARQIVLKGAPHSLAMR